MRFITSQGKCWCPVPIVFLPSVGLLLGMMKKLFVAGFSFILLSCLSIESKMTLAENGSGTLELVYTVSSFARDWESPGTGNSPLPLPINEGDFRRSVAMIPGLGLRSYSRSEENDSTVIRAVVSFTSLDALNRLVAGPEATFVLRQEGNRTVFEQTITQGTKRALDEETRAFVQAFFKPYSLRFSLTAPRNPVRVSPSGSIAGSAASVSFSLESVIQNTRPIIWRVEW